jgi:LPS sulfotransferase NodH
MDARPDAAAGHAFLVGMPRTGSTLLRHVLNLSPRLIIASETHFLARSRRLRLPERLAKARSATESLAAIVADLRRRSFWPWLGRNVTAEDLEARLRGTDLSERGLFELMLTLYAEAHRDTPLPQLVIGEKTPAHLGEVPTLVAWFPDARIVHTVRDPRGVYASRLRRAQQGEWGLKARLPWLPGWLVDPLLPPIEMIYAARSWNAAAKWDRRLPAALGERYLRIRFEDLVTDPEATVRRVCGFLGVTFVPAMLVDTDIVGSSFESDRHARSGFDAAIADRWRQEVGAPARRLLGWATRGDLARLGYRP